MKFLFSIAFCILLIDLNAQSVEWRGPERDGKYPETGLLKSWPEEGPKLILKVDSLGMGYSSAQYYKNITYVTGKKDSLDCLTALNLKGEILWQVAYDKVWFQSFPETRGTPIIKDDRVYVVGGSGTLVCIGAKDGEILWTRNIQDEYEGRWSRFGTGESPLLVDDLVVATVGGDKTAMVAFNAVDGSPVWQTKSLGGDRSYGSARLYERNGVRQILGMISNHVFGVNPKNGEIMWKHLYFPDNERVKERGAYMTNTPLIYENEVYYTCGYDVPAVKLAITEDGKSAETVWVDTILDVHHHGVILVDGNIYGTNWINNRKGEVICLDWKTGEMRYNYDFGGKSNVIFADGMLYIYQERSGEIALVKPNPEKFDMVSSFKISDGTGPHWAHPTIYDKKLFIRHGETLLVYDIEQK